MVEFTVKCPVIVCAQTRMGICHVVKNVLRKPDLIGPLESDIVKVRYMSEKATENKVYCVYMLHVSLNATSNKLLSRLVFVVKYATCDTNFDVRKIKANIPEFA